MSSKNQNAGKIIALIGSLSILITVLALGLSIGLPAQSYPSEVPVYNASVNGSDYVQSVSGAQVAEKRPVCRADSEEQYATGSNFEVVVPDGADFLATRVGIVQNGSRVCDVDVGGDNNQFVLSLPPGDYDLLVLTDSGRIIERNSVSVKQTGTREFEE